MLTGASSSVTTQAAIIFAVMLGDKRPTDEEIEAMARTAFVAARTQVALALAMEECAKGGLSWI